MTEWEADKTVGTALLGLMNKRVVAVEWNPDGSFELYTEDGGFLEVVLPLNSPVHLTATFEGDVEVPYFLRPRSGHQGGQR